MVDGWGFTVGNHDFGEVRGHMALKGSEVHPRDKLVVIFPLDREFPELLCGQRMEAVLHLEAGFALVIPPPQLHNSRS